MTREDFIKKHHYCDHPIEPCRTCIHYNKPNPGFHYCFAMIDECESGVDSSIRPNWGCDSWVDREVEQ